jgi:LacI family transcriptional regulator
LKGYRQAMEAAQLSYKSELVIQTKVDRKGGYQAAKKILKLKERPDAIFAVNNLVAVGVVQAAEEIGLAISKNLALVCFDDIEYASIICPFLTVMAHPAESFGTIALQLLLDRISGRA